MIALESVSKTYSPLGGREVRALVEFSLAIARGEVVGIAGPNGAGKSTLISLLLGYLEPSAGRLSVDGLRPRAFAARRGVSYLTELVALPPSWTVEGALRRLGTLGAVERPPLAERVEAAIAATGLEEHRRKRVRQLSKGTLQRLGLAQAMLDPRELVILDEPTHGLDPLWTQRFREIVVRLRGPDRVVLIASHNLDELERVADRVAIIHQGRLERVVVHGEAAVGTRFRLVLVRPSDAVTAAFPGAEPMEGRPLEYRVTGELPELNRRLGQFLSQGGEVRGFFAEESGLEREFRAAVGEAGP